MPVTELNMLRDPEHGSRSRNQASAVHHERVARDEIAAFDEKQDGIDNILRRTESFHERCLNHLSRLLLGEIRRQQYGPGRDGVDLYLRPQRFGQRFGQADDARLRDAVRQIVRIRPIADQSAKVTIFPAVPRFFMRRPTSSANRNGPLRFASM